MRDEFNDPVSKGRARDSAAPRPRPRRLVLLLIALGLGVIASVYALSYRYFLSQSIAFATGRATLYSTTLDNALTRFQHLPFVLARDHSVLSARTPEARRRLSQRLERFADEANIEAIYLMDRQGLTVASSNHGEAKTFLGHNYGFRPYFKDAEAGRPGRYYAVGATTRRAGFFMAEPVVDNAGATLGVLAVKVDLGPLQATWRAGGETVLVANSDGVVVLSSEPNWLYKTLRDIKPDRRKQIAAQKQFGAEPLQRLSWSDRGGHRWSVDGRDYMHVATSVRQTQWRLHYLADLRGARDRALLITVIAGSVLTLVLLAAAVMRSERLRAALELSHERRRALEKSNRQLETARHDLAQATRLAALGELAAAVVHELGQPLSAMRNYLAVAELCDDPNEQTETIQRLSGIVGRMERTSRQLKHFAEPSNEPQQMIDLRSVLDGVTLLMSHDVEEAGATLEISMPDKAVWLRGDRMRLEQAVVNLMRNGLAAMEESDEKVLSVSFRATGRAATIEVADTGRGLGQQTLSELQEPFHTTRPSGEGMGLGLSITAAIAREHGGALSARDREPRGAVFEITLPLAPEADPS